MRKLLAALAVGAFALAPGLTCAQDKPSEAAKEGTKADVKKDDAKKDDAKNSEPKKDNGKKKVKKGGC
jgi:hypothetical protein